MNIAPHIPYIAQLNPMGQTIAVGTRWNAFHYADPSVAPVIANITATYGVAISRHDIISYLALPNASLFQGFIMSFMWGHGNGVGADRLDEIMIGNPAFAVNLANADAFLNLPAPNFGNAFNALMSHNYNTSFISKYMYFRSKSLGHEHYALIFDDKVGEKMNQLNSIDQRISGNTRNPWNQIPPHDGILKVGIKRSNAQAYVEYVDIIHDYANQYDIDADQLEMFLWM